MGWFSRWRMRRAAKRYARRLGAHLARAYGPSEFYSSAQIQTGVGKLGLDSRFIAIGYAGLLSQGDYTRAISTAPMQIEYNEARKLFERFRPANLFSASANTETSNFVHYGAGHDGSTD